MDSWESLNKKVLIMTAVEAERDAVRRGLSNYSGFDVVIAGVGSVAAAVHTMAALTSNSYDIVLSMGIGGGFTSRAPIGSVVIASEVVLADLGAQTLDGFISMDKLGFGNTRLPVDNSVSSSFVQRISAAGIPVCSGPIITVSTTTGTAATAAELAERVLDVAAEAMEGYAVASAASYHKLPFVEIRTISNAVGPRDREAWRIGEALSRLEEISKWLPEVIK